MIPEVRFSIEKQEKASELIIPPFAWTPCLGKAASHEVGPAPSAPVLRHMLILGRFHQHDIAAQSTPPPDSPRADPTPLTNLSLCSGRPHCTQPPPCGIMLCPHCTACTMNAFLYFQPHPKQMGKVNTLPTGQSLFQVVGRFVPNQKYGEDDPQCKVYRMKIFAKNKVVARSRFWYFMGRLCRVKKANGQIVSVNQVRAPPLRAAPAACSPPRRPLASYAARSRRRSSRSPRRRSRTLASGSGTTRVPARTTRTRSTVRSR